MKFIYYIFLYIFLLLVSSIPLVNNENLNINKNERSLILVNDVKYDTLKNDIDSIISKYEGKELIFVNVANAIVDLKINEPINVLKQSIKESGINKNRDSYTSRLAVKYNNLFGMRKAKCRKTYALKEEYKGYATFGHWIYSLMDYKIWQDIKPFKNGESFPNYMYRRKYAIDAKNYGKKVLAIKLPTNVIDVFKD